MKENIFYLPVTQDVTNYLQRLAFEVEGRLGVIDRLFTTHANDDNDSVLTSVPFRKYHEEYDKINAEYSIAKEELGNALRPLVEEKTGIKDVSFDWTIEDFSENKVKIVVK